MERTSCHLAASSVNLARTRHALIIECRIICNARDVPRARGSQRFKCFVSCAKLRYLKLRTDNRPIGGRAESD